jgi:hypothetical protein
MTEASRYLVSLAERVAAGYVTHTGPRAILLTGSAAEGLSDRFSDLDLIVYYDNLPSPEQVAAARSSVEAADVRTLPGQEAAGFIDEFVIRGVICQVAHLTVAAWERDMASVLDACEPATVVEKALAGLLDGKALHGREVIARWQTRAADYPDRLAQANVEHHLRFFPLWRVAEHMQARDATIFSYQMLVETSLDLLGVLAGLNRRYFSSFQFKRLRLFADSLPLAPPRLADRLDAAFALDPVAGIAIERLVAETLALVDAHMPDVDTTSARRHLGKRREPWALPAELAGVDSFPSSQGLDSSPRGL